MSNKPDSAPLSPRTRQAFEKLIVGLLRGNDQKEFESYGPTWTKLKADAKKMDRLIHSVTEEFVEDLLFELNTLHDPPKKLPPGPAKKSKAVPSTKSKPPRGFQWPAERGRSRRR